MFNRKLHPKDMPEFIRSANISIDLLLAALKQPNIKVDIIWSKENPIIINQGLAKRINPDYVNFIPFEYKWQYCVVEGYLNS